MIDIFWINFLRKYLCTDIIYIRDENRTFVGIDEYIRTRWECMGSDLSVFIFWNDIFEYIDQPCNLGNIMQAAISMAIRVLDMRHGFKCPNIFTMIYNIESERSCYVDMMRLWIDKSSAHQSCCILCNTFNDRGCGCFLSRVLYIEFS